MNERTDFISSIDMEYDSDFWNYLKMKNYQPERLSAGKISGDGGFELPYGDAGKLQSLLYKENMMRRICTLVNACGSEYTILAKQCDDISLWVKEGDQIPFYEGMNDFTPVAVQNFKLCSFVKLDEEFVRDATFNFKDYLLKRFAKCFGRQEENAFLCGDGNGKPTGVLHPEHGAEVACTVQEITADDIIKLFFSLKPKYRRDAVWIMNDATALHLRKLKDDSGNYLWRSTDDSIFGRKVMISNFMPDMESGAMPVVFGDFSYYWIICRKLPGFKTLTEEFCIYSQVGYLGTERMDGKLVRREAVKAIRMAEQG